MVSLPAASPDGAAKSRIRLFAALNSIRRISDRLDFWLARESAVHSTSQSVPDARTIIDERMAPSTRAAITSAFTLRRRRSC